jgi:hypothetical protein
LPDDDRCRSLAYYSGQLVAGTGANVYMSDGVGSQWTRVPGPPHVSIQHLFAGPVHGLYASAVTTDESSSVSYKYDVRHGWQVLDFGKPARSRVDPDAGWHSERDFQPTLIGMVDDILYASSLAGLIRSRDGGQRWEPFQAGLPDPLDARNGQPLDVVFVVRKNAAGVLYAATMRGVYRVDRHEQRWEEVPLAGTRIGHAYFSSDKSCLDTAV